MTLAAVRENPSTKNVSNAPEMNIVMFKAITFLTLKKSHKTYPFSWFLYILLHSDSWKLESWPKVISHFLRAFIRIEMKSN